jgi:hypothetical protein
VTVPRYLTAAEDAAFDGYVKAWQAQLGLQDWNIYRRAGRAKRAMADITPDYKARHAGYRTGDWTHITPTEEELSRIALHEVMHVFLDEPLKAQASTDDDWKIAAEHRAIVILVKLLTREDES